MPANNISELEFQVEGLIAELTKTREDNRRMREQLSVSVQERVVLQEKNTELAEQIKRVIEQIKEDIS